ncbi:LmbE family protein [Sulfuricurvum kujiense DSM 16994]|uniref:LmbE family protein n=1 Tax=Sulfuricurvum kujiense (strain ATCC BAA-921 / DSM 16994 / JCM 11577 / YK-1) TaxID=709032 RepID=E4U396_SULKY|nr:PIG-L family deacetylase [Sulfuricurvum kujiense]ADR34793.1 LmbE family protein [Sulfuricurvum kujiense DSM 16994]
MIFIVFGIVSYLILMMVIRKRQYKYKTNQDYTYLFNHETEQIDIKDVRFFDFSSLPANTTLILKINVKSSLFGHLFQPYIKIADSSKKEEAHYLEHGVNGIRYVDLSGFSASKGELNGCHCSFANKEAILYIFRNADSENQKILVLAPHADDAEIAAYGLYSSSDQSHVITVTVGEEGKCDYCGLYGSKQERALQKGKLRVHDALSVPALGDVPQERCAMLGYFGMSLKWMFEHRDQQAVSTSTGISDIRFFRRTDHTGFIKNETASATWDSLVRDLYSAIVSIKPEIIVTAHPDIDSNSDHIYTAYALVQALEQADMRDVKLYCYTNHHIYTEAYPYGPMFSTSALAPKFNTPFACDAIYSYQLDSKKQSDKFYALEAMHDLRDSTLVFGVKKAWSHFVKQLKRQIQQRDKSYFRRAVRPNELFYVMEWETFSSRSKS